MEIKLNANEKPEFLQLNDAPARGDMYRFLSAVFLRPPHPELLKLLMEENARNELCRLFVTTDGEAFGTEGSGSADYPDVAALQQEYMDLFAVPTGRYVFPFEDVHRGRAGRESKGPLLGSFAVDACRLYREAGGRIDLECHELPTHIGVQLSFMSFACRQEAEALRDQCLGDRIVERIRMLQLAFLTDHLNQWFPQLALTIKRNATNSFYPAIARVTEEFLRWDTANLLHALEDEWMVSV